MTTLESLALRSLIVHQVPIMTRPIYWIIEDIYMRERLSIECGTLVSRMRYLLESTNVNDLASYGSENWNIIQSIINKTDQQNRYVDPVVNLGGIKYIPRISLVVHYDSTLRGQEVFRDRPLEWEKLYPIEASSLDMMI